MISLDLIHRLNLREIAAADEELRKAAADDLISYYRGFHLPLVKRLLESLLKQGSICETWKTLAAFRNVTARIVDAVTLVGREPIAISFTTEGGEADEGSQAVWDDWHDQVEWPLAVGTFFQHATLLGTVLIQPAWDSEEKAIALRLLTPNLVEVRWHEGNRNLRRPDLYSIQVDQKNGRYEVWDVRNREMWEENSNGERVKPAEQIPEQYGDPFVAIRCGYPVDSFWYEGGAEELLHTQERINYMLTQRMVALFFGGKFPIVNGAQGPDEQAFVLDISKITFTGVGSDNMPRQLQWDGPEVQGLMDALFDSIRDDLNALCEAYGMPPGSFRAQESARSGVAIQLENAPAKDKMRRDRVIHTPAVRRLVEKILDIWTYHDPEGAPGGVFDIDIPEPRFAQLDEAKAQQDIADMNAGLLRPVDLILQRHPDWDEDKALGYLQQCARELRTISAGATFGVGLGGIRRPLLDTGAGGQGDQGQNA